MIFSKNERLVVRKPVYESGSGIKNRQSPGMTIMSDSQVPEVKYYIELGWVYNIPQPNPHVFEHKHNFDEIILFWGSNYHTPQVLGAEIEFYIGGQSISVNTTAGIFIPKGTLHGPLTWKQFQSPHMQMVIMPGAGNRSEGWEGSGISEPKKELPQKTLDFDYEQYVIRSPMRELARGIKKGRQSPTMTYISSQLIPCANYYIEFGWIWDVVERSIPEMTHKDFDEIVLHIGGDPANPEDLGGDVEFHLGGEPVILNSSCAIFIPRGLSHGPLRWTQVRKPHIEMAIMLGCGTVSAGWGNAFAQLPPTVPV